MLVETLKVLLTGDSKQLESALQRSSAAAKKFGRDMNQASQAMAKAAAVLSGFGALMVREAAKWDSQVSGAVKTLKNQYSNLALELGRSLVPVLETMSRLLSQVVNWLRAIDPETKKWAAGLLAASAALLLVGSGVAKVIALGVGMAAALLPALPALAMVAAAVGTVYLATAVLRTFWEEEWNAMVDFAGKTGSTIADNWLEILKFMGEMVWTAFVSPLDIAFKQIMQTISSIFTLLGKIPGAPSWLSGVGAATGDFAKGGLKYVFKNAIEAMVPAWKKVSTTIKRDFEALGKRFAGLIAGAAPGAGPGDGTGMSKIMGGGEGAFPAESVDMGEITGAGHVIGTVNRAGEQVRAAASSFAEMFGSALGTASGAISALSKGDFAGALVAMLTQSAQFRDALDALNPLFQSVADIVGMAVRPFGALLGALRLLVGSVLVALAPAFESLTIILEAFAPMIVLLSEVFKPFATMLAALVSVLAVVINPIQALLTLAMPAFFEVVRFLGVVILKFVEMVAPLWNSIIGAIQGVMRSLANFDIGGWKPLAFLNNWANSLKQIEVPMGALSNTITDLENMSYAEAMAKAKEAAAAKDAADATRDNANAQADAAKQIEEFSESLTNVPEGFKVAAARYGAIDTGSSGGSTDPVDLIAKKQKVTVQVFIDSKEIAATMRTTTPQHNASYGQPVMEGI